MYSPHTRSMKRLVSRVGTFQLVDRRNDEDESSSRSKVSPYDWKPEYWHSYPVDDEYRTNEKPWERPEQVAMSFVGVNIVDVENSKILPNMTVKIRRGLIEEITNSKDADMQQSGWDSVDASGLYMCPGLIDCHVHILGSSGEDPTDVGLQMSVPFNLKGMLSNGFTTVRDVGGASRFHRQATQEWLIPGPRLFIGGPVLSQTGGHADHTDRDAMPSPIHIGESGMGDIGLLVDGVDACLKATRKLMMAGADHVKICSSGGVLSPTDKLDSTQFTVPEIKAVCDTVRMMKGTLVTSHCNTDEGARNAIEGGVGGIEHGGLLSDDTLRLMAKEGIHFTPTLIIQDFIVNGPMGKLIPKFSLDKAKMVADSSYRALKRAHELGVNVAYGTDCNVSQQLAEFGLRTKVLPGPVILQQATCNGAKVVGMKDKLGVIKKGAFADLLLLGANPLEDIHVMSQPRKYLKAIVKDGRCVSSRVEGLRVEVSLY